MVVVIHSVHHVCTQIMRGFLGYMKYVRNPANVHGQTSWPSYEHGHEILNSPGQGIYKWEQIQLVVKARLTDCQLIANKCKSCTLTTCSPGLQV